MSNFRIKLDLNGFNIVNSLLEHQLDNADVNNLWIVWSLTDEISFYEFTNESYNLILSISKTDNYRVYSLFKDFFYILGYVKEQTLI